MDGVHDMGGMHGMGPVEQEENEPVFHGEWEQRMFAMNNAVSALGVRNIDESRHARERMNPGKYLSSSYYEIWLDGLVRILSEKGLISEEELSGEVPPKPFTGEHRPALTADAVDPMMDKGATYTREDGKPASFKVGDRVKAKNIHPSGHTRLPRYARGATGEIIADYGLHVFADSSAHGDDDPQHLYSVRFTSRDLWGEDGHDNDAIYVDLWDDHLEASND
ncbi:nitrile hydratase subunit beta [Sneathiella sp. P13V-1]|uniref:nitrile hydratase subunit beta n=1 Tax=Sneathiella sp. P13V-1 TaxID=2697366 RepID=UPI00187B6327|nr:nitrile hydratase subunit beta [Sneathiella sp. P13V-1]MBE7636119.1 nitrile hydratase subunit beta [Sneathiella sp. P13V-1]